jgi:hypothetical protein
MSLLRKKSGVSLTSIAASAPTPAASVVNKAAMAKVILTPPLRPKQAASPVSASKRMQSDVSGQKSSGPLEDDVSLPSVERVDMSVEGEHGAVSGVKVMRTDASGQQTGGPNALDLSDVVIDDPAVAPALLDQEDGDEALPVITVSSMRLSRRQAWVEMLRLHRQFLRLADYENHYWVHSAVLMIQAADDIRLIEDRRILSMLVSLGFKHVDLHFLQELELASTTRSVLADKLDQITKVEREQEALRVQRRADEHQAVLERETSYARTEQAKVEHKKLFRLSSLNQHQHSDANDPQQQQQHNGVHQQRKADAIKAQIEADQRALTDQQAEVERKEAAMRKQEADAAKRVVLLKAARESTASRAAAIRDKIAADKFSDAQNRVAAAAELEKVLKETADAERVMKEAQEKSEQARLQRVASAQAAASELIAKKRMLADVEQVKISFASVVHSVCQFVYEHQAWVVRKCGLQNGCCLPWIGAVYLMRFIV